MFTEDIIIQDCTKLKQVNEAIASLLADKRPKAQDLLRKFQELRDNLKISIESNEIALRFEKWLNMVNIQHAVELIDEGVEYETND